MEAIYEGVRQRFSAEIRRGQVRICRAPSLTAAQELPTPLDWVYVDGDHTYEAVRGICKRFWPMISPGGYLAGDDYGPYGVVERRRDQGRR
jgi:hypothetical protein